MEADGMIGRLAAIWVFILLPALCGGARSGAGVEGLSATGHDSRIDLRWSPAAEAGLIGYNIYRSAGPKGPFTKLNPVVHKVPLYSDFVGRNGETYYYRVTKVYRSRGESPPSQVVGARTRAMTDDELLTSVQEATFRYFWDWAHPVSGMARERNTSRNTCATGGTGFGMMAIMVGASRGFVGREQAAKRLLKVVRFLQEKADRYHGAWSHWINGRTGKTIPFAKKNGIRADDGGDLVETAFLVEGMLAVRRYFDRPDPVEAELRRRITQLWREVEWDWYLRRPGGKTLYWHWSPRYGWMMNLPIRGFNECMIAYLLAIASPTHPIPPSCYYEGWAADRRRYANGRTYYGYKQWVGRPMGGPLFFTHYSFLGFDPRAWRDRFCNYFENNRNIALIHRAYCIENPRGHKGYGALAWGLTSSDGPDGYRAHAPGPADDGTIAPTAAIGSMPYTPRESIAALKHFYHAYGKRLWGEFGFKDAFNLDRNWFAQSYIAIDQGPIICMIENYRTGLCWRVFMSNPEIERALEAIGWKKTPAATEPGERASLKRLH